MPAGRPTLYKPEYCQMLIEHMASGRSYESFPAVIDTCESTIRAWEERHPEFLEAKKIAWNKSLAWWENKMIENLEIFNSKDSTKVFNTTGWVFTMKNRFKWRDRQPEEVAQVTQVVVDNKKEADEIKTRIMAALNDK